MIAWYHAPNRSDELGMFIPWEDVINPGTGIIRRASNGVRNGVCQIRSVNPGLFDFSFTTPVAQAVQALTQRSLWDEICPDVPLRPNTPPPVAGGRCAVQYRWFVDWASPSANGTRADPFNRTFLGAISNVTIETPLTFPASAQRSLLFGFNDALGARFDFDVIAGDPNEVPYARAIRFERVDGLPDNCGIQPVITEPVSVTNNFEFTLDIGGVAVSFPVELGDINIVGGVVVGFAPVFLTPIGRLTFEAGGLNIELAPEINLGGDEGGGAEVDLTPVLNRIDESDIAIQARIAESEGNLALQIGGVEDTLEELEELIRRCCCGEEELTRSVLALNSEGGVFTLPPFTRAVSVELAGEATPRTPTQSRSGTEPDIFYWGSLAISPDIGYGGVRNPLHYPRVSVSVPKNSFIATISTTYGNSFNAYALHYEESE